ncbi:CotY/CotZ family spore coat protein [Chryseomicrobium sp. FSL W7-1435]|uniref:CotY/CotZ family spore coat protein n=1 Tax=Chryseomicrobium sp. FSL W7-1435 TaxID=2921704 RepID=UPI00315A5D5E
MSCSNCSEGVGGSHSGHCVCEVVREIKRIQDAATSNDCNPCSYNCFLEPLGGLVSPSRNQADTRVFTLLTKDGKPFFSTFVDEDTPDCDCVSIYFRVNDFVDHCCVTLTVLKPLNSQRQEVDLLNEYGTDINLRKLCKVRNFELTGTCITVDLHCFCGIACVADVFLDVCN